MSIRSLLVPLVISGLSIPVAAQTLNLTFESVSPGNGIQWNYTPGFGASIQNNPFGALTFQDSGNNAYYTFCIDLVQDINYGQTLTYNLTSDIASAPITSAGAAMGNTKAQQLSLLYGLVFQSSSASAYALGLTDPSILGTDDAKQGFQIAISQIVFGDITKSVTDPTSPFYVVSGGGANATAVSDANAWLASVRTESLNPSAYESMALVALTDSQFQDQILPDTGLAQIPEPSVCAAILGLTGLGLVIFRRKPAIGSATPMDWAPSLRQAAGTDRLGPRVTTA